MSELDAFVAQKVMGWTCLHRVEVLPAEVLIAEIEQDFIQEHGVPPAPGWARGQAEYELECDHRPKWCSKCRSQDRSIHAPLPHYSTNIGHAWLVVDRMRVNGFDVELTTAHADDLTAPWLCSFEKGGESWGEASGDITSAICRAALAVTTRAHGSSHD